LMDGFSFSLVSL